MRSRPWFHRARQLASTPIELTPAVVSTTARVVLFALCASLVAANPGGSAWEWLAVIAITGFASTTMPVASGRGRLGRIAESLTTAIAVIATTTRGVAADPFLPYLVAPAFTAGLVRGISGALVVPGLAALTLIAGGMLGPAGTRTDNYASGAAEWVLIAVILGLFGAWIFRLRRPAAAATNETAYVAAYRLLSQLRVVARQLSVGLDPVTIAQAMLTGLADAVPFACGAVYARTGGDRLAVLAHRGGEQPPAWNVSVAGDHDSPFAEAWLSQRPTLVARTFDGRPGCAAVLPLQIGMRSFGLVAFESPRSPRYDAEMIARATEITGTTALRLEAALLFDEVRGLATVEERRRLAREIHDGIAQELSALGYLLDDLAERAEGTEVQQDLRELRAQMSRVINELRLSIFDLRSEVDDHGGLGAALSEYVRGAGRSAGLTVHLSLREGEGRLPADTEAELLRIAQEAVNNCRKHAAAANLWVTLEVEAPAALLRVEDDGRGLAATDGRDDSYGLEIMRERADRLRGRLQIRPRLPNGTVVEVSVGSRGDRARLVTVDHDGSGG